jgi:hypothetical protein
MGLVSTWSVVPLALHGLQPLTEEGLAARRSCSTRGGLMLARRESHDTKACHTAERATGTLQLLYRPPAVHHPASQKPVKCSQVCRSFLYAGALSR